MKSKSTEKHGKIRKLNKKHRVAIRLKYEGSNNSEIADKAGFKLNTIEKYFSRDGLLIKEYSDYEKTMNKLLKDEALQINKRNIKNAVAVLVSLLAASDLKIRHRAAKDIIERELGKAPEKIDVKHRGHLDVTTIQKLWRKERNENARKKDDDSESTG